MKKIVIALGGNAIKQADQEGTYEEQFENIRVTAKEIVKIIKAGHKVVITHGNGPQAGSLLIQQEKGSDEVPAMNMDAVGAMTQGQIGYMMLQELTNQLRKENLNTPIVSLVNQVLVDKDDPAFLNPTKPVGPFYTEEEASILADQKEGWIIKEVKGKEVLRRFRRVVPSPTPIDNIESIAINKMIEMGFLVIASGGGGVPVIRDESGELKGVAAVIDKDRAGEKLANIVNADIFLVLTDVENAYINYGKSNQEKLTKMSVDSLTKHLNDGQFAAGSMAPKVEATLSFVRNGGEKAIITSLNKAFDAIEGDAGTQILK